MDKTNTTASDTPLTGEEKRSVVVTSYGIETMFSFANIKLGGFFGVDIGIGSSAQKWNFNKRPWFGLGLGYNIAGLWGKK
ncbi:MAG: hypothetical protein JST49_03530 [Bacteroidetes bacterium]|nr:hypothetical protein [Bacteroidota bacterium]